ncbi:MAG: DMT family transporter [Litorivicinus sp.]
MAWAALIMAMLIWSSSFVASKLVLVDFTPEQAVGLRLLLAAAVTLPWLLIWGRAHMRRMTASHWKWLVLMALFEPCLYFLAEMNGLLYTSASAAGLVTSTLPLWIALGAWLLLKEQIGPRLIVGLALALTGTLTMTLLGQTSEAAPNPLLGNALMVLAMLMATGYVLVAKRLTNELSPWLITVLQIWVGAVFFVPFLLLDPPNLTTPSATAWQAMVWLGVVVSLGAYGLYNLGISQVSAQVAGMSVNLIPLFTLVLAGTILGERLSIGELLGGALILIGILVALWPRPTSVPEQVA